MVKDDRLDNLDVKKSRKTRAPNDDDTTEPSARQDEQTDPGVPEGTIPDASEVEDFEKYGVGPVTVPVREATEFMARLEEAKVNPTTLRKSVTDLSHENKFWRDYAMRTHQWARDLKKRLDEAKKQGKAELDIPPFPEAPFILQSSEGKAPQPSKDTGGEDDYLKGFAKVIGPYIALGKYLKGDDGDEDRKSVV